MPIKPSVQSKKVSKNEQDEEKEPKKKQKLEMNKIIGQKTRRFKHQVKKL